MESISSIYPWLFSNTNRINWDPGLFLLIYTFKENDAHAWQASVPVCTAGSDGSVPSVSFILSLLFMATTANVNRPSVLNKTHKNTHILVISHHTRPWKQGLLGILGQEIHSRCEQILLVRNFTVLLILDLVNRAERAHQNWMRNCDSIGKTVVEQLRSD